MSSSVVCPVCPNCASTDTTYLKQVSEDAYVHYCRCEACGHVWTMPKDGQPGEPHDVTPRKPNAT